MTSFKGAHGLTQQEVQSNLTYLISQGWVEEDKVEKSFTAPRGEFTMPKFHGIRIEATGQNIITLGDGNQINAQFNELGTALVELRDAITQSQAPEADKMALVVDIDTIQSQLAKPAPNKTIVAAAWETVKGAAAISGCADLVGRVAGFIAGLIA